LSGAWILQDMVGLTSPDIDWGIFGRPQDKIYH
jgi:hypothetical protein